MEKKRFEKTEILDEDFLEELDKEIQKKFSHNSVNNVNNINNIEILEDTDELIINDILREYSNLENTIEILNEQFVRLSKVSDNLEDTIEFLNSDISLLKQNDDIEILEEEIEDFVDISKSLEDTIELLEVEIRDNPIILRKKISPKKRPWIILLSICTIVIWISSYRLFFWQEDSVKTNKQIQEIINDTATMNVTIKPNITDGNAVQNSNYFNYLDVDFTNLIEQNSDVVGWIRVNNTNINYPFVQTTDNDFYLKHSFDKSKNSAGWVFADFRNNFSYLDKNTIIYAHGRLDNTMFGSLKKVIEKEWYSNHDNQFIQLSTVNSKMIFQVFSVYTIKPETYYITTNFDSDIEYKTFLDTLIGRSVYNFNNTVSVDNKILTLSSCYNDELRVVVHAKLVNIIES